MSVVCVDVVRKESKLTEYRANDQFLYSSCLHWFDLIQLRGDCYSDENTATALHCTEPVIIIAEESVNECIKVKFMSMALSHLHANLHAALYLSPIDLSNSIF